MSKKIRTEAVDYLFQGILSLEDKEECYTFFEDPAALASATTALAAFRPTSSGS